MLVHAHQSTEVQDACLQTTAALITVIENHFPHAGKTADEYGPLSQEVMSALQEFAMGILNLRDGAEEEPVRRSIAAKIGVPRKLREQMTKRALSDAVRRQMTRRRIRQTDLARWSGVSRSSIQKILYGERDGSLFMFMEVSKGLGIADPCELLRDILDRRGVLLARGGAVSRLRK